MCVVGVEWERGGGVFRQARERERMCGCIWSLHASSIGVGWGGDGQEEIGPHSRTYELHHVQTSSTAQLAHRA